MIDLFYMRIIQRLKMPDIDLSRLADRINISQGHLSNIRLGKRPIHGMKVSVFVSLIRELGMQDEFLRLFDLPPSGAVLRDDPTPKQRAIQQVMAMRVDHDLPPKNAALLDAVLLILEQLD